MKTENWEKVNQIVAEALEINEDGRRDFIVESCSDAPEIRQEIESLLTSQAGAEDFFEEFSIDNYAELFERDKDDEIPIGQQIGSYKIIREIGRGGMGAVYLAQRADGKFEQQVALKLLKRELNTKNLRRRFQHERQILAALVHPNIARLLDAGATDDAIPFLTMEYVEGLPIDVYCDKQNLDLKQRLNLFRQVCEAVAFAHRKLVVHRDLKPSNILVGEDGIPKLLDFGIAKLSTPEFEAQSEHTITQIGAMTPAYASPEQLKQETVSTATDVYSLGVVLYELLSGHRPFESAEGNFQNIFKAVCETEPPPPSSVVEIISTSKRQNENASTKLKFNEDTDESAPELKSDNDTKINELRLTTPQYVFANSQLLRGDLDNIVLKALKKEPERRYSTVDFFSDDIRRHLEGLPVTARPDTFSYRLEKFVKRHRAGVIVGAIIFLVIVGGVTATLWQARIAQAERLKAERRFNDVRTLANSFLFEFNPKIENLPGSLPARQLLVTRALEYLDKLSHEAGDDLQLQSELAKAYEKVGDVQGNPETPNIGDLKGALESYEKALPIRRKLLETSNNPEAKSNLANNLLISANINLNGFDPEKAAEYLAEAVSLFESVLQEKPNDLDIRRSLAKALRFSGFVPFYDGENEKALEFYNRSLAIVAKLSEELPDDPRIGQLFANLYLDTGESYAFLDKMDLYKENLQKGLQMLASLYQKHPNNDSVRRSLWVAYVKNGEMFRDTGDYAESLIYYDKSLDLAREGLKINSNSFQAKRDLSMAYKQRAVTLKTNDKPQESLKSFSQAIEISEQLQKEDPNNILIIYDIAGSHEEMSETFYSAGDYQSAISSAQKAIDKCAEVLAKSPEHTQSRKVTAKARSFMAKSYFALAGKTKQSELWKKSLANYRLSLEIYSKLKAAGKSTEPDHKAMSEIEKEIAEIEKKAG